MRAVLWHWAGGGLPLPQAKAPPTLARLVILFEPESWQWGSGSYALRGGGGRRNGLLHCWVRTPPGKIRSQFRGCKHTSLIFLVDESSEVRLYSITKTILVTFLVTSGRRQCCRV